MRPGIRLRRGLGAVSRHATRCRHQGVNASRRMGLGTRARAYEEPREGDLEEEDEYPDLSLWGEESPSARDTQMVAGERGGGNGEEESEDYDEHSEAPRESWSRRNDTTARKKGRTWHKYMKNSRELKRLQSLLPDLEGGSLFADEMRATDIEALDAETSEASLESVENLRNLEQQLDRSGFAYIAKGGKVTNMEEVMRNLGWGDPEEEEAAADAASLTPESILVDLEEEASTMEVDTRDPETLKLRAKLDAMEDHPWKRSTRQAHPGGGTQEIEVSLAGDNVSEQAGVVAQTASSGEGPKGDWAEYENPTLTKPAEQRILEKAMYSSTIRMIHDQEQQSIERARVTWFLKEQFNSEFVLSNYLAHMARSIQDEVDGIEVVNYKETGTFICRYKPMIMSKVLFDLETKLKTGEIDIHEINHLQDQSNRKADLLEKTIAFLCDRSIRMQVAKHLRRNLSFKQDQLELDPADRLDLDRLEETLKVERVENIIVKRSDGDEEAQEETILDFLLKEDGETQSILPEMPPGGYETLKPLSEVDLLPDLPEDAVIQFSIDGECVEIDLSKIGDQAIWIRQLLGYKQSDAERMANFDRLMHKTETAFQVKPRKRRDKRTPVGQKQLAEKDESRMFQEAVDIFGADNN